MPKHFFITGLPRSRTTWFAALLSGKDTFCFHEESVNHFTLESYEEALNKEEYEVVGDSNSMLPLTDINTHFPSSPVLIVHRDIDDVVKSANKHLGGGSLTKETFNPLLENLNDIWGFHISFSEIDENIDKIYEYLTGKELDADRKKLFLSLNVQINTDGNSPGYREFVESKLINIGRW